MFLDDCHFTETTYLLLSKIITKIIVKKEKNLDIDLDISNEEYLYLSNKDNVLRLTSSYNTYSYSVLYEYVSSLFKNDIKSFYELCNQYYTNFEIDKDFNIYNKIIAFADVLQNNNETKQSKKILDNLIKLAPNNFEAYLIMGYLEYKNNDFEQADKYFSKVKELNKDSYIDVAFLKSLKNKN